MEKKKPTYDLGSIKTEFCDVDSLRMTRTARNDAFSLGFTLADVVSVIQSVTREHFYKSMTSDADHSVLPVRVREHERVARQSGAGEPLSRDLRTSVLRAASA